jgi:hypothetical protein
MRVPDDILHCAVFVTVDDGGVRRMAGIGFA